jgi:hypothetical protein
MKTRKTFSPYGGKEQAEQPPERRSSECMAYGCPMPGVFSSQMRGENFVCRAHDGIAAEHWAKVTDQVKRHESAMRAAIDLTNETPWSDVEPSLIARFVARYGSDFERRTKTYGLAGQKVKVRGVQPETARDYGARVHMLILDLVRGEFHKAPLDLRSVVETWKPLTVEQPQA